MQTQIYGTRPPHTPVLGCAWLVPVWKAWPPDALYWTHFLEAPFELHVSCDQNAPPDHVAVGGHSDALHYSSGGAGVPTRRRAIVVVNEHTRPCQSSHLFSLVNFLIVSTIFWFCFWTDIQVHIHYGIISTSQDCCKTEVKGDCARSYEEQIYL